MNKTWKWILGILLVVVILGALVSAGFMWRRHVNVMAPYRSMPMQENWHGPMMQGRNDNWQHPPMRDHNKNWNHPMMNDRYSRPSGGFFLLGGLVKLALFAGLLYGAYWLGRRNARIVLDPSNGSGQLAVPAVPVADVPAPEAESPVPAPEAVTPPAAPKRGKKISGQ